MNSSRPVVLLDAGTYDITAMNTPLWRGTYPWLDPWWRSFQDSVISRGFAFVRGDSLGSASGQRKLLVTQGWTGLSAQLVKRPDVIPGILVSLESPMIDFEFYHALPRISRHFRRVFVFHGACRRVKPGHQFRAFFPPQVPPPRNRERTRQERPWSKRQYLVAVHSNKFAPDVSLFNLAHAIIGRLFSRVPQPLKPSIRRQLICLVDRELAHGYEVRLRAILHFSRFDDFALYGRGWRTRHAYSAPPSILRRALRRYSGEIGGHEEKLQLLERYRFALVIENTSFPGYISEKIFDCFYAGCVPVYYGPPDIEQFIPTSAFVDMRRFPHLDDLDAYLRRMREEDWQRMRKAGEAFLQSPSFSRFDYRSQAERLADALTEIWREIR